jgi:hypothetical protein
MFGKAARIRFRSAHLSSKRILFDAGLTGSGDELVLKTLLGGVFYCLMFLHVL